MKIHNVLVSKIKPDPNQPRQTLDHDKIKDMAQSILTEGIINPIEIDGKQHIITGEMRWRAAKLAGLRHIPCKTLKIDPQERFRRQVIENIHHNTMTDWDTAKALQKLLDGSQANIRSSKPHKGGLPDKGIRELGRMIGKSQTYLIEKLDLLSASPSFQKAVKLGLSVSFIRALKRTPDKYKKQIEEKIIAKEFATRDSALVVVQAINDNPGKAEEILAQDYSQAKTYQETHALVEKVIPGKDKKLQKSYEPITELNQIYAQLQQWLKQHSPQSLGGLWNSRAIMTFNAMLEDINQWVNFAEMPEVKQLIKE